MRIAQVCYLFSPAVGGVETHVLNIGAALVEWGHEVDVLTSDFLALNGQQRVEPRHEVIRGVSAFRFHGRAVRRTRAYSQRLRFPGFAKRLFTHHYDVIHCHSIASLHYDLSWWVARLKGIPLVVTGHYSPDDLDRLWSKRRSIGPFRYWTARLLFWRMWMRFALRHTDRVIAIAESERQRMVEYLGLSPAQVVVIPNGVNPEEFDAVRPEEVVEFRTIRGYGAEPLVLFVGRISHTKGPDIFMRAAERLLLGGARARFLVAGHPEDEALYSELRAIAETEGLSGRISLEDLPRHQILEAFHACDVVVLPSRGEVFGITLVEGMYCGKVVIGSDSGGIPEVIADGESGFLFRSDDADDLARVLGNVLDHLGDLDALRETAKRKAIESYTWERAARKLLAVYEELVS